MDLWLLDGKRVELGVWRTCAAGFVDTSIDDATDLLLGLQGIIEERLNWLDAQPSVRRKIAPDDGQRVQVVVCDEYAFYTTRSDRKAVRAFEDAFTDLVARGRAVGVVVILATQKPHSDVIHTKLRDLFAFRGALRCTTPQASDTILGQGWATLGYSAADLDPACPGVGWLLAEGTQPCGCGRTCWTTTRSTHSPSALLPSASTPRSTGCGSCHDRSAGSRGGRRCGRVGGACGGVLGATGRGRPLRRRRLGDRTDDPDALAAEALALVEVTETVIADARRWLHIASCTATVTGRPCGECRP